MMMARTTKTNNSSGSGKIMVQPAPKWKQQKHLWLCWNKHGNSNCQLNNNKNNANNQLAAAMMIMVTATSECAIMQMGLSPVGFSYRAKLLGKIFILVLSLRT